MDARKVIERKDAEVLQLEVGPFGNNVYIVKDPTKGLCALIDASFDPEAILAAVGSCRLIMILQTHMHMDHTQALQALRQRAGARLGIHPQEPECKAWAPEIILEDGQSLLVGGVALEVIHTPGHTPGSVCFLLGREVCFCGDTIFPGGPGKTSSPEAFLRIVESIEKKIYTLPDDVLLLPGHGASTSVGASKREYEVFRSKERREVPFGDVLWEKS
jgi:glyoxylase-like metal-dependent hydrolase (beta-lactamase superfamily II)